MVGRWPSSHFRSDSLAAGAHMEGMSAEHAVQLLANRSPDSRQGDVGHKTGTGHHAGTTAAGECSRYYSPGDGSSSRAPVDVFFVVDESLRSQLSRD